MKKISFMRDNKEIGVYVGRFNPPHLGHEKVCHEMIKEFGIENCLVVIGSQNHHMTLRHFFSFIERKGFVQTLFPEIKIVGHPDFETDEEWIESLEHMIKTVFDSPKKITYFGGCEEDILFFINRGRKTKIFNRFDGTTPKVSATEVRDALISKRDLVGLIPDKIIPIVEEKFVHKWEHFKKI